MSERIAIRQGDRRRNVSKQRALLKALVNCGLGGDVKAIAAVFAMVARLIDDVPISQAVDPGDSAIIDDFVTRQLAAKTKDFKK